MSDTREHGVDTTRAGVSEVDLLPDGLVVEPVPEARQRAHRITQRQGVIDGCDRVGTLPELPERHVPGSIAGAELDPAPQLDIGRDTHGVDGLGTRHAADVDSCDHHAGQDAVGV